MELQPGRWNEDLGSKIENVEFLVYDITFYGWLGFSRTTEVVAILLDC